VHKNMVLGLVSATSVAEGTEAIHIAYTSVTYDANGFVSLKSDKRVASKLVGDVVVSPLHISAESLLYSSYVPGETAFYGRSIVDLIHAHHSSPKKVLWPPLGIELDRSC